MDQIKIGKFIAQMRKEKSLTQRELADTLCISDKTVSKWENGKGMPEVSLMMPLCEALGITANELLSGERLTQENYIKKAEENIMTLVKEREESKKKIILSAVAGITSVIGCTTLVVVAGVFQMEMWARILLIAIGFVVLFGGMYIAAALDMNAGTFECKHCKHRFIPSAGAYMVAPHTPTSRYLKCPECGQKSYCKRRLTH